MSTSQDPRVEAVLAVVDELNGLPFISRGEIGRRLIEACDAADALRQPDALSRFKALGYVITAAMDEVTANVDACFAALDTGGERVSDAQSGNEGGI